MPIWLINLLISLAIKLGLPYLMEKFPNLPKSIWDLIAELLKHIHGAQDKVAEVAKARLILREHCYGPGCPTDLKKGT